MKLSLAMDNMTTPKKTRADFAAIYNGDGTCHQWDCGKPGIVLAYDEFTPESACWFCDVHWSDYDTTDELTVIEDLQPRPEPIPQVPLVWRDTLIDSLQDRYTTEFANMTAFDVIKQETLHYSVDINSPLGTYNFHDASVLDVLLEMTDYTWRQTRPGVFEHVFTPRYNSHDISYQESIPVTIVRCPGYRLTHKAIAQARQAIRAKHTRKRLRRQHRAMYRRRKRGLA